MKRVLEAVRGFIQQKKFRNKLFISMAAIAFLPIILIGTVSSKLSESVISKNYIQSQENSLSTANHFIDNVLLGMVRSSRNMLANTTIMGILEGNEGYSLSNWNILDNEMSLLFFDNPDLESMFLMNMNGEVYFYGRGGFSYRMAEGINIDSVSGQDWYIRAMEANGREIFTGFDVIAGEHSDKISCIKKMRSLNYTSRDKMEGLLIVNVRKSKIFESFFEDTNSESSYFVYDNSRLQQPMVFSWGNESAKASEMLEMNYFGGDSKAQWSDYVISEVKNDTTGWKLVNVISKKGLFKDAKWLQGAIILVSVITGVIMVGFFLLLTRSLYRPLQQLEKSITMAAVSPRDALKQNWDYGDDEIGDIGTKFNDMLQKNLLLNERIVIQEVQQKNAELQELQAKINPHFLYNILDCVYWMIQVERNKDAAAMIVKLSRIMRSSLNQGKPVTTLEREFALLEDYLFLQNMRFDNQFRFNVFLEEDLKEISILSLMLQPFVENAVIHGLENKLEGGYLYVTGKRENTWVVITIEDNGCGMTREVLEHPGYGISNVKKRLELFYGEKHRLDIQSVVGGGTTVTLKLEFCGFNVPLKVIV